MRRAEQGHHPHIAGPYLLRYAQEASWREDHRRVGNGETSWFRLGDETRAVRGFLWLFGRDMPAKCGYLEAHG